MVTATNPAGGGACVAWIQEYVTVISPTSASATVYIPSSEPYPYNTSEWFLYSGRIIPVDPVVAQLVGTNGVTQNISAIATAAAGPLCPIGICPLVSGAAADGVTQVVIAVLATVAGDSVQFTLTNENGDQDAVGDGGLFPLGSSISGNGASTLTVPAQAGTSPPLAVVIWRAPLDYNRGSQYPADATTVQRNLTLQVQLPGADGSPLNLSQTLRVVRPPVVEVHGIWSNAHLTWAPLSFQSTANATLWGNMVLQNGVQAVDYSAPVPVTAVTPPYPWFSSNPTSVTQAALGFSYNAPCVLLQLQAFIANYETSNSVAVVQADVVAHSMGGDIVRVMPSVTTGTCSAQFANQNNYGLGPVHKLITIGTPHYGTPVAVDLLPSGLGDPNYCVRDMLDVKSNPTFQSVTLGMGTVVTGAVGDLAAAPANLPATEPFPMAYLAGTTNAANLANIDTALPPNDSFKLRAICYLPTGSPLAYDLTPTLWNNVFGGEANDGVVPLSSQLNATGSLLSGSGSGGPSANTFQGVIHSPGFEALNFSPPVELSGSGGIPDAIVNLLNEATNGADFH